MEKSRQYYFVIFVFAVGAAVGALMSLRFQEPAIWVAALLLLIGFVLMFIREDMESNPQLVHEWDEIGEDIRQPGANPAEGACRERGCI